MPRRGVCVTVQALEGGGWQTFGSGRTDRRGRFRVRLPFSGRPGTFRLRAVVPTDPAFPFAGPLTLRARAGRVAGGTSATRHSVRGVPKKYREVRQMLRQAGWSQAR